MPKKTINAPLSARIENGQLVISVGVKTLAFAASNSPEQYMAGWKITDADGFAKDVLADLLSESENGEHTISRMLDQACGNAADQGSQHLAEA